MATIDTIAEDGSTDTTSAIYLVVNGVIKFQLLGLRWLSFKPNKPFLLLILDIWTPLVNLINALIYGVEDCINMNSKYFVSKRYIHL